MKIFKIENLIGGLKFAVIGDSLSSIYGTKAGGTVNYPPEWGDPAQFTVTESNYDEVTGDPKGIYATAAGQSVPNNAATVINFGTKVDGMFDLVTIGANWNLKAPIDGKIHIDATVSWTAHTGTLGAYYNISIYKNGVLFKEGAGGSLPALTLGSAKQYASVSGIVPVAKNDLIDLRAIQTSGAARALTPTAAANMLSYYYL